MHRLNLGCGKDRMDGSINIDWDTQFDPDVVHDLNTFPYPFKDNEFDAISAHHVLEHLDRPFDVMRELHRILKPGGELTVKTPHFSRGFTHSEHSHGFDVTFPLYFDPSFRGSGYTGVSFKLDSLTLRWSAFAYLLPDLGYGPIARAGVRILDGIFSFFANLNPHLCSRLWCFWVGGFEEIEFRFRKTQDS